MDNVRHLAWRHLRVAPIQSGLGFLSILGSLEVGRISLVSVRTCPVVAFDFGIPLEMYELQIGTIAGFTQCRSQLAISATSASSIGPASDSGQELVPADGHKDPGGHLTDQDRRMPAAAERPKPAGRLIPAARRQLTRTRDLSVARMPDRLQSSRV